MPSTRLDELATLGALGLHVVRNSDHSKSGSDLSVEGIVLFSVISTYLSATVGVKIINTSGHRAKSGPDFPEIS